MEKYYVVLTGAMKNAGDYLITEKCKELLRKERPEHKLVQLNRWEYLEDELELINGSDAVILLGGPAVRKDLYPNVYKLTKNLDDIRVPIIPMAVGSRAGRGSYEDMLDLVFSDSSKKLIEKIEENGVGYSVRDSYTAEILKRNGIKDVQITGCASWYTPNKFHIYPKQERIRSIAFTPAQSPKYNQLSKDMMQTVKKLYPNTNLICSFHRGIGEIDEFSTEVEIKNNLDLMDFAKNLGMEIVDLSYSFDNYKKYDEIDMHIGYRVHGHLYFLSNRKPSILIHEDGRGKSMSDTIGLKGIDAFEDKRSTQFDKINRYISTKSKYNPFSQIDVRNMANNELNSLICMHQNTKYKLMSGAYKNFDENYSIMKDFLHKLP